MNDSDFEKHLQRQPLRQIPQEWRAEILQNAAASAPSTLDPRPSILSALLWPNPKAWAALAAVWIAIFALNFSNRENSRQMAKRPALPSSEMIARLKDQQKLLAELIGISESRDAEPLKQYSPRPHSERRRTTAMA